MTDGRILGDEAVGTVEAVGAGVKNVKVGDRVLSCVTACGTCRFGRGARYGQCVGGGGWILGHLIDGTHAEFVRVPFVDTSTHRVPDGATDEDVLMLADILRTGYEVGVLSGHVQPGDVVAVVGAGPIGLSAIVGARLFSPSHIIAIDLADSGLDVGDAIRRRRGRQQQPRRRPRCGDGAHRRSRSRCRDRGEVEGHHGATASAVRASCVDG